MYLFFYKDFSFLQEPYIIIKFERVYCFSTEIKFSTKTLYNNYLKIYIKVILLILL